MKEQPNRIIISRLNMNYQGYKFIIDKDGVFCLINPAGGKIQTSKSQFDLKSKTSSFAFKIKNGEMQFFGID